MQVFLTDLKALIKCKTPHGTIKFHDLKVWPAWTYPKFTTLFSYERDGEKITVPVIMGKRYTLESIQVLIHEHLNSGDKVANLHHNNGRVTWRQRYYFQRYPSVWLRHHHPKLNYPLASKSC